jgi:hypothetical protein
MIAGMLEHSVTSKTQEGIAGCEGDKGERVVEGSFKVKKEFGVYKQWQSSMVLQQVRYFNQLQ